MDWKPILTLFALTTALCQPAGAATITLSEPLNSTTNRVISNGTIPDGVFNSDRDNAGFAQLPGDYELGSYIESLTVVDNVLDIEFTVTEGTYDTLNGLPQLITDIGTDRSKILLESPVIQDDVGVTAWGIDSGSPISTSSNGVFIFDFRQSPTPVVQFGAMLVDVEGGNGRDSFIGIYDEIGNRFHHSPLSFEANAESGTVYGNRQVRHLGIQADPGEYLSLVALSVGDDDATTGGREYHAMGDFYVGTKEKAPIATPIPGAIWLMLPGLFGLSAFRKIRAKQS